MTENFKLFYRKLVIEAMSSRLRDKVNGQNFVVHFCLVPYRFYEFDWFRKEVVKENEVPTMLFNFQNRFLTGVSYVPEVSEIKNVVLR